MTSTYKPTRLKVGRLGINISDEMNDSLSLHTSEYLMIGEHDVNTGSSTTKTMSMIVDNDGFAINSTIENRRNNVSNYAAHIYGNTRIDGNLIVNGVIQSSNMETGSGSGSGFWNNSGGTSIYHDGTTTLGNLNDANNNTYTLNISESANSNINNAHFALQNRNNSIFRMSIMGSSSNSPIIFNTAHSTPIEFHVGRTQEYFDSVYTVEQPYPAPPTYISTPIYTSASNAPHLNIDINGNVGIKTSINTPVQFRTRSVNPSNVDEVIFTNMFESTSFHVEGTMYSRNILMNDYISGTQKHLDDLYVRREGVTIDANAIIPGPFSVGLFTFKSDLEIEEDLEVTSNVYVGNNLTTSKFHSSGTASFSNNIYVQDNIYFKAGLYTQRSDVLDENGEPTWERIQFDSSVFTTPSISNVYYIGTGIATIGRLGIGALPTTDQVNHQAVIIKRDPTIFELELTDKQVFGLKRTAFIGHPRVSEAFANDASIVFLTPRANDANYNLLYSVGGQQNIYFYPGGGTSNELSDFMLESNNKPTLGVFSDKKVGINTFTPTHELTVIGDISASGSYYIKRNNLSTYSKMGVWTSETYPIISGSNATYTGISYIDSTAPHVGINMFPSNNHGLSVAGGILSANGYYSGSGNLHASIYNSSNMVNKPQPFYEYMYANGQLGIGVTMPNATMHLKDTYDITKLVLSQSPISNSTLINFNGTTTDYSLHLNDLLQTFELHYGNVSNIENTSIVKPLIARRTLDGTHQIIINSNVAYGNSKPNNTALLVNGNVEVKGDINITGTYRVNSLGVLITGSQEASDFYNNVAQDSNNVYIGGTNIFINSSTSSNAAVLVGWGLTSNDVPPSDDRAAMYVRNSSTTGNFAMNFRTQTSTCMTKYQSAGTSIIFGVSQTTPLFIGASSNLPYVVGTGSAQSTIAVGIGTDTPNRARLHVYCPNQSQTEQRLAVFTRYTGTVDSADFVSDITLQKIAGATSSLWRLQGPNLAANQKLQFMYGENNTPATEVLCITKYGCIGIGNTNPTFAIDINSSTVDRGSIRMVQSDGTIAKPQLLFQSGPDMIFGSDQYTDYRFYAFQNTFTLDASKNTLYNVLFNFNSNNNLGICQLADDRYTVSINGSLNVNTGIYVRGQELFTILPNPEYSTSIFNWENIFLNPKLATHGGVTINGTVLTSNIFQVNSGNNGNLAVFNSIHDKSYIHFRNVTEDGDNIYRVGLSNNGFIYEFACNVANDLYISDISTGYIRASELLYTEGRFIQKLNGSIELTETSPSIHFNGTSYIECTNANMHLMTNNFGIGTTTPISKVHISSDNIKALIIEQQSDVHDILNVFNHESTASLVISASGNVGIGTTSPIQPFHVSGNTCLMGLVGIGTTVPTVPLHVIGKTVLSNESHPISLDVYGNTSISSNINVGGNCFITGDMEIQGNIINDSDKTIKHDIRLIEDALTKIKQLSGYTFSKRDMDRRETGVIAQEVQSVIPEAVFETSEGVLGVAYGNLVGLLIEGIKELSDKIENLKTS